MAKIQCKMCGGELQLPENVFCGECPYCGTLTTFPQISSAELENLYNRAEHFRRINEYDKAVSAYEKIVEVNPEDAEAYWGLVISKFGIEYVEDPVSHERIPTCHRAHYESILADPNYLTALEKAGSYEKNLYETEAKRIAEIQKGILSISNNEQPFDIFICYKESDKFGRRTKDSVTAQEIYHELTKTGYKVFFAKITLESKLGQQYEPYIFAALNSAKVMLVIGSEKEYFDAVWVRNEWSRFLALMKNDKSKLLIPCFRDMDAYDIPEALSMFQAQDMGKIGFMQDLLHGIKKVVSKQGSAPVQAPAAAAANTNGKDHPFLQRAKLFLETADFNSAIEYCEKLLDINPQNGWAYFYRLMAENKITDEKSIAAIPGIAGQKTFSFVQRFADETLAAVLNGMQSEIAERQEEERKVANDLRLRVGISKYNKLLSNYIDIYNVLSKKNDIIRQLSEYLACGKKLLTADHFLDQETVSHFLESADALINSQPPIADLKNQIKRKLKRRNIIIAAVVIFIAMVIGIPISIPYIRGYHLSDGGTTITEITNKDITEFTIPAGVTKIGDNAFLGCSSLTSVTIPDSVTEIGGGAFWGCSSLTSVTIPDSVTKIDSSAFKRCTSLTSVTIPDSVTKIDSSAFEGCTLLTSVTIPDSVTKIDSSAFEGCTLLTSVTIPDSVTSIGHRAFWGCSNLKEVSIPRNCSVSNTTFPEGCRVIRR